MRKLFLTWAVALFAVTLSYAQKDIPAGGSMELASLESGDDQFALYKVKDKEGNQLYGAMNLPLVNVTEFKTRPIPPFLEGQVHIELKFFDAHVFQREFHHVLGMDGDILRDQFGFGDQIPLQHQVFEVVILFQGIHDRESEPGHVSRFVQETIGIRLYGQRQGLFIFRMDRHSQQQQGYGQQKNMQF